MGTGPDLNPDDPTADAGKESVPSDHAVPAQTSSVVDAPSSDESADLGSSTPLPRAGETATGQSPRERVDLKTYLEELGFELHEELGRGGMGVVFKAKQIGLNRFCALKIIKPDRLEDGQVKARFFREVQAAAKLSHPNIVTVFQTKLDGPYLMLAMEYVPGATVLSVLRENGPFPYLAAIQYVKQVASGLEHAFEQGMVHRDIKPANLMITPWPVPAGKRPVVKILDMGLARSDVPDNQDSDLTVDGTVLGTPDYMAPEQAEDPRLADIRSDLYSLGGTFFVMLTGRWMFREASTLVQKLKKHLVEVPPLVHTVREDIPPALSAVVAKLLEKEPGDRYQTPQELIEALEAVEGGQPIEYVAKGSTGSRSNIAPVSTGKPPVNYAGHSGPVYSISVSANGQIMVSGGSDETIQVWEIESNRSLRPLPNIGGPVVAVALSPDVRTVATASARLFEEPNQVDVWDLRNGRLVGKLRGMKQPIQSLAFSPRANQVAAGAEDGAVLVWSLDGKSRTVRLSGHKSNVTAIQFVAGGDRILTACRDGTVSMWDIASSTMLGSILGGVGPIRGMAAAGSRIAMAGDSLRLRFRDGSVSNFSGQIGTVECVAISPDRDYIVAGGSEGSVRLWRTDGHMPIEEFPTHGHRTRAVAFGPDGSVFSAGDDGYIRRNFPAALGSWE